MAHTTLADIASNQQIAGNSIAQNQQQQQYTARQQAAQQAAQLYQQGDVKGAYSAMISADPGFAEQILPQLSKIDPDLAGQLSNSVTTGQQSAENAAGNGANQVATTKGQYEVKAAQAKANAMVDRPSTKVNPADGLLHTYKSGVDMGVTQDANGNPVNAPGGLNPVQQKGLTPFVNDFKKTADKLDDAINGSEQVQQLIAGNLPGSKLPAVMKFLTSEEGIKRFNEAEFTELGKPGDIVTQLKQNLQQKADGKPWTTDQQQWMTKLAQATEISTYNDYFNKIQSTAAGAAAKTGADPDKVESIVAANAHPQVKAVYDTINKVISKDPNPAEAKQLIDFARRNFADPRSKAIFQHYGINF